MSIVLDTTLSWIMTVHRLFWNSLVIAFRFSYKILRKIGHTNPHLLDIQLMLWNLTGCAADGVAALLIADRRGWTFRGHLNVQVAAIRSSSAHRRRYRGRVRRGWTIIGWTRGSSGPQPSGNQWLPTAQTRRGQIIDRTIFPKDIDLLRWIIWRVVHSEIVRLVWTSRPGVVEMVVFGV